MKKKCVMCGKEFYDFACEDRCGECVAVVSKDDYIEVKIRARGEDVEVRVPLDRSQGAVYTRHYIYEFINHIHYKMSVKNVDDDGNELYEPPYEWRLGTWKKREK
jgi:ribosomal protein S26